MARTVQDVALGTRSARLKLAPRKKPYYRLIDQGRHLGYYRGPRGGTWLARLNNGGRYVEAKLGLADDSSDPNGIDVLSFADAQAKAREWFDAQARGDSDVQSGPYTVSQACDDYLEDYLRRSGKDEANTRGRLNRIKAALGRVEVNRLTSGQIKKWHSDLSDGDPLTRSNELDDEGKRRRRLVDRNDPDVQRRRKASANRMLTVLKAVLNHAFQHPPEGVQIASRAAWERVRPFREADAPKIRYLDDEEARRLRNACPIDFRDLVEAALQTGCRYGELCRLRVRDFDEQTKTLRVETSKSGRPRSVALTDEGVQLFARLSTGKTGEEPLLARSDGSTWRSSHQLRRMEEASKAANINPPVSFHILRHTYASRLAMRGAPMPVIAAQLGHQDTRMTERHYAHLGPSYVAETVRALFGSYGLGEEPQKVISIRAAKKM
jgi:integrase